MTSEPPLAPDAPPPWARSAPEVLASLASRPAGLDPADALRRLRVDGPNTLPAEPPVPLWVRIASQFRGFLTALLAAAAVIAWLVGDLRDALMIGAATVFNAVVGFALERRADRALRTLRAMAAPLARVRRDGAVTEVPAADLVAGDIVVLAAGDRVPADGRLVAANGLEVDESSLTGESVPVAKSAEGVVAADAPLAERPCAAHMNSVVTRGRGEFVVTATGAATEVGRIAGLLAADTPGRTPLQAQLDDLAKRLALVSLVVVGIVAAAELLRGVPLAQTAIQAIALAVAAVPEGLPAVVTVTLALGMHRMAGHRAIVKRLPAVETLGCTTVICSDKTGTLTRNEMTVREVRTADAAFHVEGEGYVAQGRIASEPAGAPLPALLLETAVLCNDGRVRDGRLIGDPTEGALVVVAAKAGLDADALRLAEPRIAEVAFESERRFMATFHRGTAPGIVRVCVKGAPGTLLDRASDVLLGDGSLRPLGPSLRREIEAANEALAARGLRVLAVAARDLPQAEFGDGSGIVGCVARLRFLGLVGMIDPPRTSAREAIRRCAAAGIGVKMITGDQRATAASVARDLGIAGEALTGGDLDAMDDAVFAARLPEAGVFARVSPEHKLRIVAGLQAQGHVVAMTGDGVNDAPALRRADIGVAMGSGTAVAGAAAGVVLLDDDFSTIVRAVAEGRAIYDNILKFVRFQLTTNAGALLTVFAAPLAGLVSPLGPAHVLWVAMISDGPPAIMLGLDTARPDLMSEPPRPPAAQILTAGRVAGVLFSGAVMAAGTLAVLAHAQRGAAPERAATLAFTTFVLFQMFSVLSVRAGRASVFGRHLFTNGRLWLAIACVVALQVAATLWAPLRALFGATHLTPGEWATAVGVAAAGLVLEEARKLVARRVRRASRPGA